MTANTQNQTNSNKTNHYTVTLDFRIPAGEPFIPDPEELQDWIAGGFYEVVRVEPEQKDN